MSGIEEYEYGRFAWIMDPEGNRVELREPPMENRKWGTLSVSPFMLTLMTQNKINQSERGEYPSCHKDSTCFSFRQFLSSFVVRLTNEKAPTHQSRA